MRLTPPERKAMISLRRPSMPRSSSAAVITAGGVIWVSMSGILKRK